MNIHETQDTNRYGAKQTNGLVNGTAYHASVDYTSRMTLREVRDAGGRITRVRILTERVQGRTFCDISYIHATLPDGKVVDVANVTVDNLTPRHKLMGALIAWAKAEGVYGKGIGLLDHGNWSVCD
jgi:hypothetical protein